MNNILVIDTFSNTSSGFIALLQFPEKIYPQIGMLIKKSQEECWKITGFSMGKYPEFTSYRDLEFDSLLYGCNVLNERGKNYLKKGDILYL